MKKNKIKINRNRILLCKNKIPTKQKATAKI